MTEHDLTTLVRDHVRSDEPPFTLTPDAAISRGRRTSRTRRLVAGGATLAVLAVGGAAVGPQVLGSDAPRGESTAIDPATSAFLADYDASQMPRILEEESRAVLERSVDDLGPATFEAGDNQGAPLAEKWWDRASGMSVSYGGDSEHRFAVDLAHARGEAEGDVRTYCEHGLADGSYLECSVDVRDDGAVVITNLWALRPFQGGGFMVVTADELATVAPDRLWFEHRVKVIKSETFVTYVSETLKAPSLDAAEAAFEVPVADLAELGTDPQVVMPAPEPDPVSGCPGFVLPDSGVTCGTFEEPTPAG
ncbi:hypothetical protein [Nocardioides psychrotolerans]|uniref:hypothetical protein n=1 Tax=Nocardioides psychrotolerans TaxID=1005945 RepID=UPI003137E70E